MLVAPNGAAFVSDVGHGRRLVVFGHQSDAGGLGGARSSSKWRVEPGFFPAADYAQVSDSDVFPAPAPASPLNAAPTGSATFASAFAGGTPNGMWLLFLSNDTGGDTGSTGSYCLTVATTSDPGYHDNFDVFGEPSILNECGHIHRDVRRADNNALVTAGTVTFRENGTVLAGPIALNGSGQASFSTSSLNEGAHIITATYSGVPGSFNTSFGTTTQQVDNQRFRRRIRSVTTGRRRFQPMASHSPTASASWCPGWQASINNLTVSLNGLTNATPDDWDFLLVSPTGQKYVLMGDAGGSNPISGVNIVLSDAGARFPIRRC